jgi:hypothetical protein
VTRSRPTPRHSDGWLGGRVEAVEAVDPVGRDDRCEDLQAAIRGDQRRDAGERVRVEAEDAEKQRSPRESHGDELRAARERRRRHRFDARCEEQGVAGSAPVGAP